MGENETLTPLKDAVPTENPDEIVTEIVTEIGKPRHILDKTESYLSKNLDTLGLLSELLISARLKKSSTINDNTKGPYKLLKFPGSLEASLSQMTDEMGKALNAGRSTVLGLKQQTFNVNHQIKNLLHLLKKASKLEIKSLLPIEKKNLQETVYTYQSKT